MAGSSNRSWPEPPSPDSQITADRPGLRQTPAEYPHRTGPRASGHSARSRARVTGQKPRRQRPWPRHRSQTSRFAAPRPLLRPDFPPGRPPPTATRIERRRRTAGASTHPGPTAAEPTAPLSCRRFCPIRSGTHCFLAAVPDAPAPPHDRRTQSRCYPTPAPPRRRGPPNRGSSGCLVPLESQGDPQLRTAGTPPGSESSPRNRCDPPIQNISPWPGCYRRCPAHTARCK